MPTSLPLHPACLFHPTDERQLVAESEGGSGNDCTNIARVPYSGSRVDVSAAPRISTSDEFMIH